MAKMTSHRTRRGREGEIEGGRERERGIEIKRWRYGEMERWTHQLFNMRTSKGTSAQVPGTKYPLERMKKSFALAEIIGTFS